MNRARRIAGIEGEVATIPLGGVDVDPGVVQRVLDAVAVSGPCHHSRGASAAYGATTSAQTVSKKNASGSYNSTRWSCRREVRARM
jgi:hypothetical protein